ncbi:MAG: trypsin-like peptidase domain-containing protein [Candidatus Rokubacteria bacterium]|nr:trypsin-like peptidase domain-containing protein [Candidatus Rokubacteria bacterium]
MRAFLIALALLGMSGCVGRALPPHRPYATVPFTPDAQTQTRVHANGDWQDSGVSLHVGDRLFIEAQGAWSGGLGWESGPGGAIGMDIGRILETEPAATALIGRIGTGTPFRVGDQVLITDVRDAGPLLMRINDPTTWDNSGFVSATIFVKRSAATQSPDRTRPRASDEPPAARDAAVSAGSGFLLRNTNYVLTNYHVVKDGGSIKLTFPSGEEYQGRVAVRDRANDLALVEVRGLAPSPAGLTLATDGEVKVGEMVHALGYPLGSGLSRKPSLVSGVVSSTVGMDDDITRFRTTAPINPGTSGGPLINSRGDVVGIAAAGLVRSEVEAIRFAVKASAATLLLRQIPTISTFDVKVVPKDSLPRAPERIFEEASPYVVLIEAK